MVKFLLNKGPVVKRSMTDIICCAIFLLYIGGMVGVFFYKYKDFKLDLLKAPLDSEANTCGKDKGFEDYPYLFLFTFTEPYRSVCVKECPKFDYAQMRYNSTGKNSTTKGIKPVYFEDFEDAVRDSKIFNWFLVGNNPDDYDLSLDGDKDDIPFNYDKNASMGYYTEQQFNSYLKNFKVDCKLNNDVKSCQLDIKNENWVYDSRPYFAHICFPLAPRLVAQGEIFAKFNNGAMGDIETAKWLIIGSIGIALLIW